TSTGRCTSSAASGSHPTRPHCSTSSQNSARRPTRGTATVTASTSPRTGPGPSTAEICSRWGESTQAEMERLIGILDDLAARIGPKAPWDAPDAAELDSISFHHWLRQQSDDELACDNIGLFIAGGMLTKPAT